MLLVDLQLGGDWAPGGDVLVVGPVNEEVWLGLRVEKVFLHAKLAKIAHRRVSRAAHRILRIECEVKTINDVTLFLQR